MSRDSASNTFLVAGSVCGVCALLVSLTFVILKPIQEQNKKLDIQRNILLASAVDDEERESFKSMSADQVGSFFQENFRDIVIRLEDGADVTEEYDDDVASYMQIEAAELEKEGQFKDIEDDKDLARIKTQELRSHVYIRTNESKEILRYIFPVRGKGLWSTLKGFIALQPDLKTIAYLTFYSHAETPGLGGEVDNEAWKQKWDGKLIYDDQGEVAIQVVKGSASTDYQVDGLSGATITSRGVQNMLVYWMGSEGFGPFIKSRQESGPSGVAASN